MSASGFAADCSLQKLEGSYGNRSDESHTILTLTDPFSSLGLSDKAECPRPIAPNGTPAASPTCWEKGISRTEQLSCGDSDLRNTNLAPFRTVAKTLPHRAPVVFAQAPLGAAENSPVRGNSGEVRAELLVPGKNAETNPSVLPKARA